jgi:2-polyprenyl-3-methyl-5-hydroxy-6-metoxy-1,4-benzoquinol methylase
METIEHIDDDKGFLREMHRILKKNGIFIVSTPQNAAKSAPLIPYHVREYNLQDFKSLLAN